MNYLIASSSVSHITTTPTGNAGTDELTRVIAGSAFAVVPRGAHSAVAVIRGATGIVRGKFYKRRTHKDDHG